MTLARTPVSLKDETARLIASTNTNLAEVPRHLEKLQRHLDNAQKSAQIRLKKNQEYEAVVAAKDGEIEELQAENRGLRAQVAKLEAAFRAAGLKTP